MAWKPGKYLAWGLWAVAGMVQAAAPGGEGTWKSGEERCFTTRAAAVPQVCGTVEVHWKYWTLMGEPVSQHRLRWSLTRVGLREGTDVQFYRPKELPLPLQEPARRVELELHGVADVPSAAGLGLTAAFPFNTGVAAPANGTWSMNVPGSTQWHQFLMRVGLGVSDRCDARSRTFHPAPDARAAMKAGIQLDNFYICTSASRAYAGSLDHAISKYCKAGEQAAFCAPAKAKKPPASLESQVEDAFASLQADSDRGEAKKPARSDSMSDQLQEADASHQRDLRAQEKARRDAERREAAQSHCEAVAQGLGACLRTACGAEPSKSKCTEWGSSARESTCPPGKSCLQLNVPVCQATQPNPEHAPWQACAASAKARCEAGGTVEQCVARQLKSMP